jgi:hypothetical protein
LLGPQESKLEGYVAEVSQNARAQSPPCPPKRELIQNARACPSAATTHWATTLVNAAFGGAVPSNSKPRASSPLPMSYVTARAEAEKRTAASRQVRVTSPRRSPREIRAVDDHLQLLQSPEHLQLLQSPRERSARPERRHYELPSSALGELEVKREERPRELERRHYEKAPITQCIEARPEGRRHYSPAPSQEPSVDGRPDCPSTPRSQVSSVAQSSAKSQRRHYEQPRSLSPERLAGSLDFKAARKAPYRGEAPNRVSSGVHAAMNSPCGTPLRDAGFESNSVSSADHSGTASVEAPIRVTRWLSSSDAGKGRNTSSDPPVVSAALLGQAPHRPRPSFFEGVCAWPVRKASGDSSNIEWMPSQKPTSANGSVSAPPSATNGSVSAPPSEAEEMRCTGSFQPPVSDLRAALRVAENSLRKNGHINGLHKDPQVQNILESWFLKREAMAGTPRQAAQGDLSRIHDDRASVPSSCLKMPSGSICPGERSVPVPRGSSTSAEGAGLQRDGNKSPRPPSARRGGWESPRPQSPRGGRDTPRSGRESPRSGAGSPRAMSPRKGLSAEVTPREAREALFGN